MKTLKTLITVLAVIILASCSTDNNRTVDDILNSTYRVYQISGYEGPKIDIKKDSLAQFLTALHYNIPLSEIESALEWSPETTQRNIDALIENKLLTKKGDYYQPALGIITLERGNVLEEKAQKVANEIADSIYKWLPEIKKIHNESNISQNHDFRELSFFYLCNVILDNFQIQRVEKEFLNQERPLRNGARYYLGILEDDLAGNTEPYGIYGNRGLFWSDSIGISVFGNKRTESNIGWDDYEDKNIHVFDEHDTQLITQKMPDLFFPTLLDILEKNRPDFEATYRELNFDEETSFEEFFIFWYHWIYTETTDVLIAKDIIQMPQNDMFYYQVAVNF
jgi:DNA-binding MarR family transcriptional regulator